MSSRIVHGALCGLLLCILSGAVHAHSANNDECANATVVGEGSHDFDNTGSVVDGPSDADSDMASDVWFLYTASDCGTATFETCSGGGSLNDTVIIVYDAAGGCPMAGDDWIASDDDSNCAHVPSSSPLQSRVSIPVKAGSSYFIQIGGSNGILGEGVLTIAHTPFVPPPITHDCGGSPEDLDGNGTADGLDDRNGNGISDGCDIAYGFSLDQNDNGIPDETECPLSALVCSAVRDPNTATWQVTLDWETPLLDFWGYTGFEVEISSYPGPPFDLLINDFPWTVSLDAAVLDEMGPCQGEFSLPITVTGSCMNTWEFDCNFPTQTDPTQITSSHTFMVPQGAPAMCTTEIIPMLDYQFSLEISGTTIPGQVQVPPNLLHAPFHIDARIIEGTNGDCDSGVNSSHGFSMGVKTPEGLEVLEGVAHPELVEHLNGHPEFFDLDILSNGNGQQSGWTVGVLYDLFAPSDPPLSADFSGLDGLGVVRLLYATIACPDPMNMNMYTLSFDDTLGPVNMYGLDSPHVVNLVAYHGEAFLAAQKDNLTFMITTEGTEDAFQRADCNGISGLTLADAVLVLNYLYNNGGDPACLDACDANDSGMIEMGDAIFLLSYLFVPGSGSPPAPYPAVGSDPTTEDSLGCVHYATVPCP